MATNLSAVGQAPHGITWGMARITNPITRVLAGRRLFPLWAVIQHRGRRSGREYAIPVAARMAADTVHISVPWGPGTQWVRNVLAAGGCGMRWRGSDFTLTEPELIGPDEALAAFHPIQRRLLELAGVRTFLRLRMAIATND